MPARCSRALRTHLNRSQRRWQSSYWTQYVPPPPRPRGPAASTSAGVRLPHKSERFKPYMISDLVLELDAHDHPHVRTLEDVQQDGKRPPTLPSRRPRTTTPEERREIKDAVVQEFYAVHGVTDTSSTAGSASKDAQQIGLGPYWEGYEARVEHLLEKYSAKQREKDEIERVDVRAMKRHLELRRFWAQDFKSDSANAADLLQYALRGSPWKDTGGFEDLELQAVMREEQLGKEDIDSTVLRTFAWRYGLEWDGQRRLEHAGFRSPPMYPDHGHIHRILRAPRSLQHLNRMLVLLTSQKDGALWITSRAGTTAIENALEVLKTRYSPTKVLKVLNTLLIRLENVNVAPPVVICREGLRRAVQCECPGAVQRYLQVMDKLEYEMDPELQASIRREMGSEWQKEKKEKEKEQGLIRDMLSRWTSF